MCDTTVSHFLASNDLSRVDLGDSVPAHNLGLGPRAHGRCGSGSIHQSSSARYAFLSILYLAAQSDRVCHQPLHSALMMSTMQKFVAAVLVCALAASTLPAASSQNRASLLLDYIKLT